MLIRPATLKDAYAIADINVSCWKENYKGHLNQDDLDAIDFSDRLERQKTRLSGSNDDRKIIIAESDGKIIGYASYKIFEHECRLGALYVTPSMQGHGIGTHLFKEIAKITKESSVYKMTISTLETLNLSRHFYEKMGGKVIEEDVFEFSEKSYSTVIYTFNLSD